MVSLDQEDVQDPGFDQYPVSDCSLTTHYITKMKGDVALSTLSGIDLFQLRWDPELISFNCKDFEPAMLQVSNYKKK